MKVDEKPRYPVGVSILLTDSDGRVLLGRRAKNIAAGGLLSTPGGRIEENENRFQCALREFRAETGAEIYGALTELGWREHNRYGMHYFMVYFHATGFSGEIQNMEPDKCEGWSWYKFHDIPLGGCTEPEDILWSLKKRCVEWIERRAYVQS